MGKEYKANNEGGYGNPPVGSQFQKGGKPGPGRPLGSTSMKASLKKVLGGKVDFKEGGKPKTAAATEELAKRALSLGLSGSERANLAAIALAERFDPVDEGAGSAKVDLSLLSEEDLRHYGRILHILTGRPVPQELLSPPILPSPISDYSYDNHMDGVQYKCHHNPQRTLELLTVGDRAYWNAARPRERRGAQGNLPALRENSDEH